MCRPWEECLSLISLHVLMQATWTSQSISKCHCIIAHPLEFPKAKSKELMWKVALMIFLPAWADPRNWMISYVSSWSRQAHACPLLNYKAFALYSVIHEWLPKCYFSVSVKVEKMPRSLNFLTEFTSGLISIWRLTETFGSGTYYWGKKQLFILAQRQRMTENLST